MSERFINTLSEPLALRHALTTWLAAEFLRLRVTQQGTVRLLSPWLSDVPLVARGATWAGLAATTGRPVRTVLDLLGAYAHQGGHVQILVRKIAGDRSTMRSIDILSHWADRNHSRITIRTSATDHAKIWVGHTLSFFGSSNLTEGGLGLNRELMHVSNDGGRIAALTAEADVFLTAAEGSSIF